MSQLEMEGPVFKLNDLHRQMIACVSLPARRRGEFLGYPCTRPRNVYTARAQFFRIPLSSSQLRQVAIRLPPHPPSKSIFLNLPSLNSDHCHRKIAHDRAVKPCGGQTPQAFRFPTYKWSKIHQQCSELAKTLLVFLKGAISGRRICLLGHAILC